MFPKVWYTWKGFKGYVAEKKLLKIVHWLALNKGTKSTWKHISVLSSEPFIRSYLKLNHNVVWQFMTQLILI
jgi:hypothetical protein